ncbi:MAG: DUF1015 domain-containing protein [Planctomycetota bacterium]|nr:MAG: DUF1015 domain-containing protein [Planctomycetota bacterium]
MPEITPFCGLRYNPDRFANDFSNLIAPPYDVLDDDDKDDLLSKHEQNIVAVDLPHVPPKSAGPDELYAKAAKTLAQWLQDGTLIRDHKPAIYVYHQLYEYEGKSFTRRKFFARMRLEEFGKGTVFPHEQTFGGPKEDRLKLMEATKCQLSAIFALYSDPDNKVSTLLNVDGRDPDLTAELQGITNKLWVVNDASTIKAVQDQMADRPVYIADGHHRYGTALMYRDKVLAESRDLPTDHPARFILVGLCAMEDPGAVILPTHRVLSDFGNLDPNQILTALEEGLKIEEAGPDITDPKQLLPENKPYDMGIYIPANNGMYTAQFNQRQIIGRLAPQQSAAWQNLDLAYLHRYLIDELVTKKALGGKAPKVHCVKSLDDTIKIARDKKAIAFITKACTMDDLRGVSAAGDLMPQKSTFFYPKLATGLVINPLQ